MTHATMAELRGLQPGIDEMFVTAECPLCREVAQVEIAPVAGLPTQSHVCVRCLALLGLDPDSFDTPLVDPAMPAAAHAAVGQAIEDWLRSAPVAEILTFRDVELGEAAATCLAQWRPHLEPVSAQGTPA